jgi:hypothetical protein
MSCPPVCLSLSPLVILSLSLILQTVKYSKLPTLFCHRQSTATIATMGALLLHAIRGTLAALAIVCVAFTTISILLTLAAGTMQLDGNYPTGPGRLWLSWLSVVRFQGLVPLNTDSSSNYQVTFHWFLSAFGWEWPEAAWEQSCGIVHNIEGFMPGRALTLPTDLALAARKMRLPEYEYACLDPEFSHLAGFCHNDFLAAWYQARPALTSFSTVLPLLGYYFAIILVLSIAVAEVVMRFSPSLARCQCPALVRKRNLCPCLKEGEEMTAAVRNRMRIWNLSLLATVYVFSSAVLLAQGVSLTSYLNNVEAQAGRLQMHAGIGAEFLQLSAGTLAAILFSIVCLQLRVSVGPDASLSWLRVQGEGQQGTAVKLGSEDKRNDDASTLKV